MKATDKLLRDVGAVQEATTSRQSLKFRLPNGALFIRAHETCNGRTAMNQYKMLQRLLNIPGMPPND